MTKEKRKSTKVLAGAATGILCAGLLQPFDVVKTRVIGPLDSSSIQFRSSGKLLFSILQNEGMFALWKGSIASILRVGGGAAIYFASLDLFVPLSDLLSKTQESNSTSSIKALSSGALARTLAAVAMLPVTVLKTRFEGNYGPKYGNSYLSAIRGILKQEGVSGFYKGLVPLFFRDVPYSGLSFWIFMESRNLLKATSLSDEAAGFLCGALSGGLATAITHPGEVLKTKMQLEDRKGTIGLYETCRVVYHSDGTIGFFRGFTPRVIKRSMSSAISWYVFTVYLILKESDVFSASPNGNLIKSSNRLDLNQ